MRIIDSGVVVIRHRTSGNKPFSTMRGGMCLKKVDRKEVRMFRFFVM